MSHGHTGLSEIELELGTRAYRTATRSEEVELQLNAITKFFSRLGLFHREITLAARLRHPDLVQFIGASMEGELILLTELMSTSLGASRTTE